MSERVALRVPLLLAGMLGLAVGVLAGLARLGVAVPEVAAARAGLHGPLMICAFFGTVISLERAVALGNAWAYAAPAFAGLGGLALIVGAPLAAAQALFVAAALVLVAGSVVVVRRQPALFTLTLGVGALCWLIGNLAWLGDGAPAIALPWWLAFLVITIAGERLELTRFLPARRAAPPLFVAAAGSLIAGAAGSLPASGSGLALYSGGLLALALWLLKYDIARHNCRQQGLTRYIAICLLSGYGWLAAAGLAGLAGAFEPGHPWRDAALHALTLGFVLAMVFGHAPIIFPAVAKVRIPYHPFFYAPLVALHASLAARVAGSISTAPALHSVAAVLNALTLLAFVLTMAASVLRGRRAPPSGSRR